MRYAELVKTADKIYVHDKYGEGPYQDAYAGVIEVWLCSDSSVYVHEVCVNRLAYTGKPRTLEYIGIVSDADALKEALADFNGRYKDRYGNTVWSTVRYYCSASSKLLAHRRKAMMSQTEVAEKIGVTQKDISRWETGAVTPSVESLKKLADVYGVTVDELI